MDKVLEGLTLMKAGRTFFLFEIPSEGASFLPRLELFSVDNQYFFLKDKGLSASQKVYKLGLLW